ncbi:hypothetical protein AURDEDRAFT_135858 [Auricularia subglabra TFB-10046 SS5]|nr:hypothetical protein AURDEDRAFT_135858 [Auricularia subglabra TFB-10046 SS5]
MELITAETRIAVAGPSVDAIVNNALHSPALAGSAKRSAPFHIELFVTAELLELRRAKAQALERICSGLDVQHILPVGICGREGSYWLLVVWNAGQLARKRLGLPPRAFYVQLSVLDDVDVSQRGFASLLDGEFPSEPSLELLDHLSYAFSLEGNVTRAYDMARQACIRYSHSERGFLRLADAAFALEQWKVAMLAYGQTLSLGGDEKLTQHCRRRMLVCAQHTEWGHVFLEDEMLTFPDDLRSVLLRPWPDHVRTMLSTVYSTDDVEPPSRCVDSTKRLVLPVPSPAHSLETNKEWSRLPRFFRWLVPFHFALMSTPRDADDVALLGSPLLGIKHVLTLTEETPLQAAWFRGGRVGHTFMPIPNYQPPSIEQMDVILRLFADGRKLPILVHCGGGKGRAGTVAACYLAAFGFAPVFNGSAPTMEGARAMALLRAMRPGSIETAQQEAFVQKWCSTLWKRQTLLPDVPPEPAPCPLEVQGDFSAEKCGMLVLVGLPGAGKSWFSQAVAKRDPDKWTWISQDEIGSRAKVEDAVGRAKKRIILDRCNTSADDRRWFLKLADRAGGVVCVWFDYTAELCTSRAQARPDHPTLPPGGRVRAAVEQMQEQLVPPTLADGFGVIITVRSFAAADELVRRLCPTSAGIIKFPRTPHLIDLGAATDDDIVQALPTPPTNSQTVITEKIDGANMGFSIDASGSTVLVQNRSHYVNPASHEQFRKLGAWTSRHSDALRRVLGRDPQFPERYILYGEWLAATHSIPYARLPALFIAFDLYDRAERSFASRDILQDILRDTGIELVPIVHRGEMPSEVELVRMASEPSLFYDGPREGIYVKLEADGKVLQRGKVVRKGFIAGNEHWTKGIFRTNVVICWPIDAP